MADETAVAVVEWISAARAGEILGGKGGALSKRRVLEYAQSGALKSRRMMDPETRQMTVQVHAGDVERLREERENPKPHAIARQYTADARGATGASRTPRALPEGKRRDAGREAPHALADLAHKLYLTEDEAVRYTGLGRGYLRERVTWHKIGARGAMVAKRVELEAL